MHRLGGYKYSTNPNITTTTTLPPLRIQAPTIKLNHLSSCFTLFFLDCLISSINNHTINNSFNKLNHLLTKPLHIEHRTYTYILILQASKHKHKYEFRLDTSLLHLLDPNTISPPKHHNIINQLITITCNLIFTHSHSQQTKINKQTNKYLSP